MTSVSVETTVGVITVGYTYDYETKDWYTSEQYGHLALTKLVNSEGVPEYIKEAARILMKGQELV